MLVPMGEPLRRLCVRKHDTLVRYAAYQSLGLLGVPRGGCNSIPITLLRTTLHYSFLSGKNYSDLPLS